MTKKVQVKAKPVTSSKSKSLAKTTKSQHKLLDFESQVKDHKLLSPWQLTIRSFKLFWKLKKPLIYVVIIYAIVNFVLAKGLTIGGNGQSIKDQVSILFKGNFKSLDVGLSTYGLLLGSLLSTSSATNGDVGFLIVFIILVSLAIIWVIRSGLSGAKVKARDAYYFGIYPFVGFFLLILLVSIELLPMIVGVYIYVLVTSNSIATTPLENLLFAIFAGLFSLATLYFLSESVISLYIVTLPKMRPIQALKAAHKLVKKRRIALVLRIIYLPILMTILSLAVVVPVIILYAGAAATSLLIVSLFIIIFIHLYLYQLYRDLL